MYVAIVKPKLSSNEMNSTFLSFKICFATIFVCMIKDNITLTLSFYPQIPSIVDVDNKSRQLQDHDLLLATEVASFMK